MADNPQQAAEHPPDIITLPAFRVLGVRAYCGAKDPQGNPGTSVQALWDRPFMERHDELKALSVDGQYLGMAWECDAQGGMDYMAGMIVANDAPAPLGLTEVRFPASQWARFAFTFSYMKGKAPDYAHKVWLPKSGWQCNPAIETVDFTIYAGESVWFHIPVVAP